MLNKFDNKCNVSYLGKPVMQRNGDSEGEMCIPVSLLWGQACPLSFCSLHF